MSKKTPLGSTWWQLSSLLPIRSQCISYDLCWNVTRFPAFQSTKLLVLPGLGERWRVLCLWRHRSVHKDAEEIQVIGAGSTYLEPNSTRQSYLPWSFSWWSTKNCKSRTSRMMASWHELWWSPRRTWLISSTSHKSRSKKRLKTLIFTPNN